MYIEYNVCHILLSIHSALRWKANDHSFTMAIDCDSHVLSF